MWRTGSASFRLRTRSDGSPTMGSAYTAEETREFEMTLNLVPCFAPVQSPESNGIFESVLKTFERDYAHVRFLPDAATPLRKRCGKRKSALGMLTRAPRLDFR